MSSYHNSKYHLSYCIYGLIILFLWTVTAHPILNENYVIKNNQSEDYADENPESANITLEAMSKSINSIGNDTSANHPHSDPSTTVEKAKKDTGNTTVIIVFTLIVFTIIVKTAPVVISYSLPYFYGPADKKVEAASSQNGENPKEVNITTLKVMDTKEAQQQPGENNAQNNNNNHCRQQPDDGKIVKTDYLCDSTPHLSKSDIQITTNCDHNDVKRTED